MWQAGLPITNHDDGIKVAWLLRHGATVKCDKFGKTPMSDAAENKQIEVSTFLQCRDITGSRL